MQLKTMCPPTQVKHQIELKLQSRFYAKETTYNSQIIMDKVEAQN